MATGKRYRAHSGSGEGSWRAWLTAAILITSLGATVPAVAEDGPCPKAAAAIFHANDGWRSLTPEAAKDIRILAIGSSSTAGIGASDPLKTYPAQLQERLAGRLGGIHVTVENAGISGETADATEARLETVIEKGDYDVVVWQVGTNDAMRGVDPETFQKLLLRGVAAAKRTAARLVLLNPQFFPGISDPARYESFVRMVDTVGAANGVPVFSRYDLMKSWAGVSTQLLAAMLFTDKFHMSDRGYGCVADGLAENIVGIVPASLIGSHKGSATGTKVAEMPAATLKPAVIAP